MKKNGQALRTLRKLRYDCGLYRNGDKQPERMTQTGC